MLFTNRKSHVGFRLVQVTLNDLERRNDRRPALSLRKLSFLFAVALAWKFAEMQGKLQPM